MQKVFRCVYYASVYAEILKSSSVQQR